MKILNLKDRLKLVHRALKLAVTRDITQVSFIWSDSAEDIQTHTFYADGRDPKQIILLYFSYVAGKSSNFEGLSERTRFLLNKIAVAYCLHHKLPSNAIQYTPEPFREAMENPIEQHVDETLDTIKKTPPEHSDGVLS